MASSIQITFLQDFIEDYELRITTRASDGTLTSRTWTWVTPRTTAFEVTVGVPTGTDGERTALNFKTAFDLDLTAGYTTSVTNNVITITSTTAGEDFIQTLVFDENGEPLTRGNGIFFTTYNNFVPTVDIGTIDVGLMRSPYYINVPFYLNTTTSSTIDVYIWTTNINSIPSEPTYTITKARPTTDFDEFNTNVANIIRDNLAGVPPVDETYTTSTVVSSSVNTCFWVYFDAEYTDTSSPITNIVGYFSALDGYGYYSEGVNPFLRNRVLLTDCSLRKVARGDEIIVPFLNDGSVDDVEITGEGSEINESHSVTTTDNANDFIKYAIFDTTGITSNFVTFDFLSDTGLGPITIATIVFEIIDECKYDTKRIIFKNKYGVFDNLWMFKKSIEKLTRDSDEFINNYISGGTYDTTRHQYKDIDVTARESITMNSGFIGQEENELYKQLFLSDEVYLYDGSLIPIKLKTKELEYKTRTNDTLIKYTVEFDYAYNIIQDV